MDKKRRNRIVRWVIIVLVVLAILYLGIGAYSAATVTQPGEHDQYSDTPADFGAAYEEVSFPAREDDLKITAWYLPNETGEHAVILVHGRNASKQNAISGTFPKFGAALNGGICGLDDRPARARRQRR